MRLDLMGQAINEGERLKREGMKLAADKRPDDLLIATDIARMIARVNGKVTSDMVQEHLIRRGFALITQQAPSSKAAHSNGPASM